jgi:HD-like signal output (HDOD) protein
LLHDVGQLWLSQKRPNYIALMSRHESSRQVPLETAELDLFGVTHGTLGAWLCEGWGIPHVMCQAIQHHHDPAPLLPDHLAAILHVAEVLSNALDTSDQNNSQVSFISTQACDLLGLRWDESLEPFFGRIEAISRFTSRYFSAEN